MSGWRSAWYNGLRRGCLESGVFIGSQGRHPVEQALARLSGWIGENKGATEMRNSGMTEEEEKEGRTERNEMSGEIKGSDPFVSDPFVSAFVSAVVEPGPFRST